MLERSYEAFGDSSDVFRATGIMVGNIAERSAEPDQAIVTQRSILILRHESRLSRPLKHVLNVQLSRQKTRKLWCRLWFDCKALIEL